MSKITRRSFKRKKIIMGASLFGATGLVSTGFAAWVLSSSTNTEKEASLHVGVVSNKNMEFDVPIIYETSDGQKTSRDTYSFDAQPGDGTGRVRAESGNEEVLSLSVETTLHESQNLGKLNALITCENDTFAKQDPESPNSANWTTDLDEAIDKGYIVAPEAYVDGGIDLWKTENNVETTNSASWNHLTWGTNRLTLNIVVDVVFAWGDFFGGINPSVFFDSDVEGSEKNGLAYTKEEVAAILVELHDLLDGVKLKLTLQADPN